MATAVVGPRPQSLGFRYYANVLRQETRYEFLKMLRLRVFSLSVVGFPVMFYLLFGVANRHTEFARYLLASYSCFGMVGASLFGLGAGIAGERVQGWLELKQASPMPRMAYLVAKTVSCAAFALLIVMLLITIGVTLGGVTMTRRRRRQADRNHPRRCDSLRKHGAAARPGDAGECRSGNHQFDLSADVVLLRAVDATEHIAALDAEDSSGAADVSLRAAGAEHLRLRAARHGRCSDTGRLC